MAERGYIDGILSTHFDECSIAAADAARQAVDLFQIEEKQSIIVQPVGRYETTDLERFSYVDVGTTSLEHQLVVGEVHLRLAKSNRDPEFPLTLMAFMNHDMVLPLATFVKRANGQCSYVQLGQEIEDDELIVTPNASRSEYVEAVRSLINSRGSTVPELVTNLLEQEVDLHSASIERHLAPAVCRLAIKYYESEGASSLRNIDDLHILNTEMWPGSELGLNLKGRELTFVTESADFDSVDGRTAKFYLARETTAKQPIELKTKRRFFPTLSVVNQEPQVIGNLQLLMVLRGGVALKLAEFSEAGEISYGEELITSEQVYERNFINILTDAAEVNRQYIADFKEAYTLALNSDNYVLTIDIHSKFVSVFGPTQGSQSIGIEMDPRQYEDWYHFRKQLRESPGNNKWKLGDLRSQALAGYDDVHFGAFYKNFDVEKKVEKYLGPGDTANEQLIATLGDIVARGNLEFEGILPNRQAGKTKTDVDTIVRLAKADKKVRVLVEGRPLALDGFDYVTLFDETLRLDTVNNMDDDKLKELAAVVGAICVSK